MGLKPETVYNHYNDNQATYNDIRDNLEKVKHRFLHGDTVTRRQMIRTAHRFAVLSIQTPVHLHEAAFKQLEGLPVVQSNPVQSVNYWRNKLDWINHLDGRMELLDEAADLLMAGRLDEAHRLMIDRFKGLGAAKAGFTIAMLGFTSKMCIDTNVKQAADLKQVYSGVVVEKYEQQCTAITNRFNTVGLTPFMLQWVLFDVQRGEISRHQAYFNAQL